MGRELARRYFMVPANVVGSDRRWHQVGLFFFPIAALLHMVVVAASAALGIKLLVAFNGISVPLYIAATGVLLRGRTRLAFVMCGSEVTAHAIVGTFAMGWNTGAALPLVFAPFLVAYGAGRRARVVVVTGAIATLVALRRIGTPLHVLPSYVESAIFVFAACVTVGIVAGMVFGLDAVSTRLEGALAVERAKSEELLQRELAYQVAERSRELGAMLARSDVALDARHLREGERFDRRYSIVKSLGAGGMGAVYEVERLTDKQHLALKVILGAISARGAARFAREAEIGARVQHRNLVSIVDVGVSSGVPFLVMELVRGGSLESQRHQFGDIAWALPLLAQIAAGLRALHEAGVVHRDLKPANVLLQDQTVAKISDFGISSFGGDGLVVDAAAPTLASSPASPALTGTGMVLGTPSYMAPEAARSARTLDSRADIFAFGVLAYEALTGSSPFRVPAVLLAQVEQPIPAAAPIDGVARNISVLLAACLDADPAKRPTAPELLHVLDPRTRGVS